MGRKTLFGTCALGTWFRNFRPIPWILLLRTQISSLISLTRFCIVCSKMSDLEPSLPATQEVTDLSDATDTEPTIVPAPSTTAPPPVTKVNGSVTAPIAVCQGARLNRVSKLASWLSHTLRSGSRRSDRPGSLYEFFSTHGVAIKFETMDGTEIPSTLSSQLHFEVPQSEPRVATTKKSSRGISSAEAAAAAARADDDSQEEADRQYWDRALAKPTPPQRKRKRVDAEITSDMSEQEDETDLRQQVITRLTQMPPPQRPQRPERIASVVHEVRPRSRAVEEHHHAPEVRASSTTVRFAIPLQDQKMPGPSQLPPRSSRSKAPAAGFVEPPSATPSAAERRPRQRSPAAMPQAAARSPSARGEPARRLRPLPAVQSHEPPLLQDLPLRPRAAPAD